MLMAGSASAGIHWDPCNTALLWWSQTSVHILYCTEKTPLTYITLIFTSNCGVISSLLQSCLDLFGNNTVLLTQSVIVYVLSASFYLSHPFFFCVCVCACLLSSHLLLLHQQLSPRRRLFSFTTLLLFHQELSVTPSTAMINCMYRYCI